MKLSTDGEAAKYEFDVMKACKHPEHVVHVICFYPPSGAEMRSCLELELLNRDVGAHIRYVRACSPVLRDSAGTHARRAPHASELRKLPFEQRKLIAREMFQALEHIHGVRTPSFPRGIVHMDIKPVRCCAA